MLPTVSDLRSRVRELRDATGLTQQEAAERADVSQSFVAKLEQGRNTPNYADAVRLYNVLEAASRASGETAADLMTADPVTVAPDDSVATATDRMTDHGFSQLPVVDGDTCTGTVTTGRLLDAASDDPVRRHAASPLPTVQQDAGRDAVAELLGSADAVLVRDADGRLAGIITTADLI